MNRETLTLLQNGVDPEQSGLVADKPQRHELQIGTTCSSTLSRLRYSVVRVQRQSFNVAHVSCILHKPHIRFCSISLIGASPQMRRSCTSGARYCGEQRRCGGEIAAFVLMLVLVDVDDMTRDNRPLVHKPWR